MLDSIHLILSTKPSNRKTYEIELCANHLSQFWAFRALPWQTRLAICQDASFIHLEKYETIKFQEIEKIYSQSNGPYFILVLKGSCVVRAPSCLVFAQNFQNSRRELDKNHECTIRLGAGSTLQLDCFLKHMNYLNEGHNIQGSINSENLILISLVSNSILDRSNKKRLHEILEIMKRASGIYQLMSTTQLRELCEDSQIEKHKKGSVLLRAWEQAPCVYVIKNGTCAIETGILGLEQQLNNGKKHDDQEIIKLLDKDTKENLSTLRILAANVLEGNSFGELSIINSQRLWASLVVKTNCKVSTISKKKNDEENCSFYGL